MYVVRVSPLSCTAVENVGHHPAAFLHAIHAIAGGMRAGIGVCNWSLVCWLLQLPFIMITACSPTRTRPISHYLELRPSLFQVPRRRSTASKSMFQLGYRYLLPGWQTNPQFGPRCGHHATVTPTWTSCLRFSSSPHVPEMLLSPKTNGVLCVNPESLARDESLLHAIHRRRRNKVEYQ